MQMNENISSIQSIVTYWLRRDCDFFLQTGHFTPWEELVPETKSLIERGLTYSIVNDGMGLYSDHKKSAATDTTSTLVPTTDTVSLSICCLPSWNSLVQLQRLVYYGGEWHYMHSIRNATLRWYGNSVRQLCFCGPVTHHLRGAGELLLSWLWPTISTSSLHIRINQ